MTLAPSILWLLGATLTAYVVGLYAMCFRIQGRIQSSEDFLVAGRNLNLPLASATILATWFGAGTVLTAADEVRQSGVEAAALEPIGSGVCLLLAGFFLAGRLWTMKLLTLGDLFRLRYGRRAEVLASLIMVPSYFGWVAAQFVALAGMLHLFFGISMTTGIVLVALVGTGYTLMGGMWSVTLTDAVQMALILVGLVALGGSTLSALGEGSVILGLQRLWNETPPELRQPVPLETLQGFVDWLTVFAIAALGNLPSQDLVQRIFASRSAAVARRACLWSGYLYILFGLIPVTMGLAGRILFPETLQHAILPALAHGFTQPLVAITFTVMLASAVLSSIDSGILAPAAVLSENVFRDASGERGTSLAKNRRAVLVVGAGSLAMAFAGKSAYSLLEEAYAAPLVGLFVPMAFALYDRVFPPRAALFSMLAGTGVYGIHLLLGLEYFGGAVLAGAEVRLPVALAATIASFLAYVAVRRRIAPSLETTSSGSPSSG